MVEQVTEYLRGLQSNMKENNDISIPDSIINMLISKYGSMEGELSDIESQINDELESYIDELIKEKLAEEVKKEQEEQKEEKEDENEEEKAEEEQEQEEEEEQEIEDEEIEQEEEIEDEEEEISEDMEEPVEEEGLSKLDEDEVEDVPEKIEEPVEEENNTLLSNTAINLMLLARAKTPEELQSAVSRIPNLNVRLKDLTLSSDEFENTKRAVFDTYKGTLTEEQRNNELGLSSMADFSNFADALDNNYDSITLEDGRTINLNDFPVEEKTREEVNTTEAINSEMVDNENIVNDLGNMNEQETRDVVDNNISEKSEMDIMFTQGQDDMTKTAENAMEKSEPKVLKITPPSEQGFAYSPAINIVTLILLVIFFIMVCIALI